MNSHLSLAVAQSRQQDLRRAAEAARAAGMLPRRSRFARFGHLISGRRPEASVHGVAQRPARARLV